MHLTETLRELLPHVFTLTLPKHGGIFLRHWLLPKRYLFGPFPLGSRMPFVARTFLSRPKAKAIEPPTMLFFQFYKDTIMMVKSMFRITSDVQICKTKHFGHKVDYRCKAQKS